jgi:hypothetical protein
MHERLLHQRLVALFVLALLVFNYPLIALWDHEATVLGLPLFPAALFGLWALLIVALAWLLESGGTDESKVRESTVEAIGPPPPDQGPRP